METLQKWLKEKCNKDYTLDKLESLKELNLNNNQLTRIPESICKLKNLRWLSLGNNQLTSVPESICELKSLRYLALHNNKLTTLPESICGLKNLGYLYLYNNHLFINKKQIQLIEFLDKFRVPYTLVEDTLLTDVLV